MAEFKFSRLRYRWRGEWSTSTDYILDDVVYYRGKSWVCVRQHTASDFAADVNFRNPGDTNTSPAWLLMTEGYEWRGEWESGVLYEPGNIALFGGVIYLCIESHTSSSFNTESFYWTVYASANKWSENWTPTTTYGVGEVVKYFGTVYKCRVGHDSQALFEDDINKWTVLFSGVEYRGDWIASRRFAVNDIVKNGGTIFRCVEAHTSTTLFDSTKFEVEFFGNEFGGVWNATTAYAQGSVVRHGGFLYYAKTNNLNSNPGDEALAGPSPDWALLSKGTNLRGDWSAELTYKTGDVVRRGGTLYIAINDSSSDGSTLDYLDSSNWEVVIPGDKFRSYWTENTSYELGDVVLFDGTSYRANFAHISSADNFPGDNGNALFYWDIILQSPDETGLTDQADLLSFGTTRSIKGDGSTLGPKGVNIGNEDELLRVSSTNELDYRKWRNTNRFFYVAKEGVDDDRDPDQGINPFKPFRTIAFAAKKANDGFEGTTKISVGPGEFKEVLPISIPYNTVMQGNELRSTTVLPNDPTTENVNATLVRQTSVLNRIIGLIPQLMITRNVVKTPANILDPVYLFDEVAGIDELGNPITVQSAVVSDQDTVDVIQDLFSQVTQYLNFFVLGVGASAPAISGSNTRISTEAVTNAVRILEANKEFFAQEAFAFLTAEFPTYNFVEQRVRENILKFVNAFEHDIQYPGNYETLLAARFRRNQILGSKTEDMFYCRDATGVRDCTLGGLEGTLNPSGVFELFQRPTGGAYCSLDPGWGPDHEDCWIMTRSPYIQGVTTTGYAAIGQKIDGALHNGGNKSMVSNDFTQVISDGIGAWVDNNGRAELVSVFTYYAQVGYLATNGGIIRSANGNCSYGNYGAYATGFDESEVYETAIIDNQSENQALIDKAFAGEVNDEILALEYLNAGINYSQANATFLGAGINADVEFDDFRNNAIFRAFISNPLDSGVPGGGGYAQIGNNAQTGDEFSITLASSYEGLEEEILGLRVIITSGTGTGQYGYVNAYNDITKVVTVYRESDNQPGWDHVVSGTPPIRLMDTSTTYRLEPRPVIDDPGFSAANIELGAQTVWANGAFGGITQVYSNVSAGLGTGDVEEQDGLTPTPATFDVVRRGEDYTVTLADGGAGYAERDVIRILGSELGGVTPDNDITITVISVSDDSTNSILGFRPSGVAPTGRFVITAATGNTVTYSDNGDDWETSALPSNGNWICIANGNNRFVAIEGEDGAFNPSNQAAYSLDGISWTAVTMPSSQKWSDLTFGDGLFVAVSKTANAGAFSTDGITWTTTTLPTAPDSTLNEWIGVTYGAGHYVAVSNSNNISAKGTYNPGTNNISWELHIMDVIDDSSQKDWVNVEWGNNRYVAISSQGDVAYSFDGDFWYPASMPSPDGSSQMTWTDVLYADGIFFAVCNTGGRTIGGDATTGPTTYCATSPDGIVWTNRFMQSEANWSAVIYGAPDTTLGDSAIQSKNPMFIVINEDLSNVAQKVFTGAKAIVRPEMISGRIIQINLLDPGSGYRTAPNFTFIDPNNTGDVFVTPRIGDGVLAQPSWKNRGLGYRTSSTTVNISGNGVADIIPINENLVLDKLSKYPGPGTQLLIDGLSDVYTVILVTELGQNEDGTFKSAITVDPTFSTEVNPEHLAQVRIRERYSQCRISGHDFLDIGTGNFVETNYPEIYSSGAFFRFSPEDEVTETDGGRVFYASTDQDGNFRAGELFAVEQATGIVTISAQFFDLDGLSELRLGGIRVGGSGVVIREFSTDPLFTEDSNNVVPTQRAIAAFLQNQLSVGGSELTLSNFVAGTTSIGPDSIGSSVGIYTRFPERLNFQANPEELDAEGNIITGQGEVNGTILANKLFYASFADDPNRQT